MVIGKLRVEDIEKLSDEEVVRLAYDWGSWEREGQRMPEGRWYIWLLMSGRGYGKTRVGAETVRKWAEEGYSPIALVGQSKADVRDTMVEVGDSSLLKISAPDFMPVYEPSKRRLTWPNGVQAIVFSGDEPDQLRGLQMQKAWCDELAKFMYPQATWDNLMMSVRAGKNPQTIVTTTPRPLKLLRDLVRDKRVVVTRGHTLDNKENLAPEFLSYIMGKYEGTKLGRQELAGELLEKLEGLVYDTFRPEMCVIPRRAINNEWPRYTGHDFGQNNTACVWFAQDPGTGFFYLYRTYLKGGGLSEHVENFKELSAGETILRSVGGNHTSEQPIRDGYKNAGWPIAEPAIRGQMAQIERVKDLHNQNRVYIFSDLAEYLEEQLTMSWEIDKDENMLPKIHNESQYHYMACTRTLLSEFAPHTVRKKSNVIHVQVFG